MTPVEGEAKRLIEEYRDLSLIPSEVEEEVEELREEGRYFKALDVILTARN